MREYDPYRDGCGLGRSAGPDPQPFPAADPARARIVLGPHFPEHAFDRLARVHPGKIGIRREQEQAVHPVLPGFDGAGIGGQDNGEMTGDEDTVPAGRIRIPFRKASIRATAASKFPFMYSSWTAF